MVFNHGEAIGVKKLYGLLDLTKNLDFYHNVADSILYLYLDKGYPNVVYNSIEIGTNNDIFTVPKNSQNVVFDNLCMKYTGSMCINVRPNNQGIVIKNCEMGWVALISKGRDIMFHQVAMTDMTGEARNGRGKPPLQLQKTISASSMETQFCLNVVGCTVQSPP